MILIHTDAEVLGVHYAPASERCDCGFEFQLGHGSTHLFCYLLIKAVQIRLVDPPSKETYQLSVRIIFLECKYELEGGRNKEDSVVIKALCRKPRVRYPMM
jgi:hypothetical protein